MSSSKDIDGASTAKSGHEGEEIPASELTRPSPDAILADEADPDTLLGNESDSEAENSSKHPSPLLESEPTNKGYRASRQLFDASAIGNEVTPTQTSFPVEEKVENSEEGDASPQVVELQNQVTSLNNKLVNSFMRVSDLEDDVSDLQEKIQSHEKQIETLEKERGEHLAALNTGLLVEKEHVSTEMQKMMERLVQETAEKGKAVNDKQKIEAELDELSSSLFSEANKMVAVEKLARARADEKSRSMEERLKNTEEIMEQQQKRLVELQEALEKAQGSSEIAREQSVPMTKGKARISTGLLGRRIHKNEVSFLPIKSSTIRLDIVPYVELRAFLNHLRRLRLQLAPFYNYPMNAATHVDEPSTASGTPTISRTGSPALNQSSFSMQGASFYLPQNLTNNTLTSPFLAAGVTRHKDFPTLPANVEQLVHIPSQIASLAFLKRINEEDCEPCLRLDFAPGLNWLSRRQMQTSILEGAIVIEPIFGGGIYDEEKIRSNAVGSPPAACALCGRHVVNVPLPGGGNASDVSPWASAASSIQASVGAMASSLPGRDATSSPPLGSSLFSSSSGGSAKDSSNTSSLKSKSSIFSTLRSISASSGRTSLSNSSSTPSEVASQPVQQPQSVHAYVPDDPFARRAVPIPTHIFRISETSQARYLLCPDFCLRRLRATCDLWGYVRTLERAVVLEGKYAWDDEQHKKREEISRPRSPQEQENSEQISKSNLNEAQGEDSRTSQIENMEANSPETAEDVSELPKDPGEGEKSDEEDDKGSDNRSKQEEASQGEVEETSGTSGIRNETAVQPHDATTSTASEENEDGFADAQSTHSEPSAEDSAVQTKSHGDDAPESEEEVGASQDVDQIQSSMPTRDEVTESQEAKTSAASPLPKTARPIPRPPPLPPRRGTTPGESVETASEECVTPSPDAQGPEPRRVLSLQEDDDLTWEEKVWLEINQLRADMWSARVGVQPSQAS